MIDFLFRHTTCNLGFDPSPATYPGDRPASLAYFRVPSGDEGRGEGSTLIKPFLLFVPQILSHPLAYPLQHKAKLLSQNERGLSLPRKNAEAIVYRVAGGGFEPPTFGL